MDYLLFLLSGTFSSWGSPLPGNIRKTDDHPTKSGIIGFIAACLGITCDMEEDYMKLAQTGFACRTDVPGTSLMDFQTVRIGPGIVSERYYLINAVFTICLWENSKYILTKIKEKIEQPVFAPFLGRKCCTPDIFPNPLIIRANTLSEAFGFYMVPKFIKSHEKKKIFWEGDDQSIKIIENNPRCDQPTGIRKNTTRIEHVGWEGVSKCI